MLFADLAISQACPSSRFLEEMATTIPWPLFETQLNQAIRHKPGGRPPFPRLLLFKIHLLQTWFGLSDFQAEFQCQDRLSFRKFLGLGIDAKIPDSTTIETFRHELLETGLHTGLLATLDQFFQDRGLLLKQGSMVDASFIKANCKPRKNTLDQSDPDADWGNKGFGYSATANVDRATKLIRRVNTTSERPHDSQQLAPVIVGDEGHLYADSGYLGQEKLLQSRGIVPHIVKRRVRGKKGNPRPR